MTRRPRTEGANVNARGYRFSFASSKAAALSEILAQATKFAPAEQRYIVRRVEQLLVKRRNSFAVRLRRFSAVEPERDFAAIRSAPARRPTAAIRASARR